MSAVVTPPTPVTVTPPPSQLPTSSAASPPLLHPHELPLQAHLAGLRRFTPDQYHAMVDHGILIEGERVELLDGYVVNKMPKSRPHVITLDLLRLRLDACRTPVWGSQS